VDQRPEQSGGGGAGRLKAMGSFKSWEIAIIIPLVVAFFVITFHQHAQRKKRDDDR
jgi:hypothetical protein